MDQNNQKMVQYQFHLQQPLTGKLGSVWGVWWLLQSPTGLQPYHLTLQSHVQNGRQVDTWLQSWIQINVNVMVLTCVRPSVVVWSVSWCVDMMIKGAKQVFPVLLTQDQRGVFLMGIKWGDVCAGVCVRIYAWYCVPASVPAKLLMIR